VHINSKKFSSFSIIAFITQDVWHTPRLALGLILITFIFALSRLPFFIYYPLPYVAPDTPAYLEQVANLESGQIPSFSFRTPGYPLFWWFVRLFSHDPMAVIFAQCTITLFTLLGIPILLAKYQPRLVLPISLAFAIYCSAPMHLAWDLYLLTDGLYVNAMLWALTCVYIALIHQKPVFAVAGAFLIGMACAIRPNGAFLIAIILLAALWALLRYRSWRLPSALLAPLLTPLCLLFGYNWATTGIVGFSCLQSLEVTYWTWAHIQPDPSLSPDMNEAIRAKNKAISDADKTIINESWDLYRFQQTMDKSMAIAAGFLAQKTGFTTDNCNERYLNSVTTQNQLNWVGIRQNPIVYVKYIAAVQREFFLWMGATIWGDFYSHAPATQYYETFVDASPQVQRIQSYGDYYNPRQPVGYRVTAVGDKKIVTSPQAPLADVYIQLSRWRDAIFQRTGWAWVLVVAALLSILTLFRSRGKSAHAFFALLLVLCVTGNAMLCAVAISGVPDKRYVYSTEFVVYLFMACGLILPFSWFKAKFD